MKLLQNTLGVTKITFGENLFLFGVLEITFGVLGAGLFMNKTGQERTLFLPCCLSTDKRILLFYNHLTNGIALLTNYQTFGRSIQLTSL